MRSKFKTSISSSEEKKRAVALTKLSQTLQEAETRQLTSFLKQRAQTVDSEIKLLSEKLRASGLSGGGSEVDGLLRSFGVEASSAPTTLRLEGSGITIQPRPQFSETIDTSHNKDIGMLISRFQKALQESELTSQEFIEILYPPDIIGPTEVLMIYQSFLR